MNLWVRSQDKECLTNISNIQYAKKIKKGIIDNDRFKKRGLLGTDERYT